MILITGGTGTSGREIIKQLAADGIKGVRALVRDTGKATFIRDAGYEVVQGDFDQPETLDAALAGVEKAFLLSAPDLRQVEQQSNFIKAARRAGTKHVVKFSAIGADSTAPEGFGKWHGLTEDELKASGLAYTMLRPTFFMQNLLGQEAQTIKSQGAIFQPVGDGKAAYVDVRDIAAVAVKTLTEDGHEGKTYEITGPEALSYDDIAAKLSAATGQEVKYVKISPEDFRKSMLGAGLPEWMVDALGLINGVITSGNGEGVTDVVREVARKEPITFDQFAQDNAQAFKA